MPSVDELPKWPQFFLLRRMRSIYDITNLVDSPLKRWHLSFYSLHLGWLCDWYWPTESGKSDVLHESTLAPGPWLAPWEQAQPSLWGEEETKGLHLPTANSHKKVTQPKCSHWQTHEGAQPRSEEPPNWAQTTVATCSLGLKPKGCYFKPVKCWVFRYAATAYPPSARVRLSGHGPATDLSWIFPPLEGTTTWVLHRVVLN